MLLNYALPTTRARTIAFTLGWIVVPVLAIVALWELPSVIAGDRDEVVDLVTAGPRLGFYVVLFAFHRWIGWVGASVAAVAGVLCLLLLISVPALTRTDSFGLVVSLVLGMATPGLFVWTLRHPLRDRRGS